MPFVLTIVYIVLIYLTPDAVLPELAPFHIQVWIAALTAFASLPAMTSGGLRVRGPQLRLLAGLMVAISVSRVVGQRWVGGLVPAWLQFLPSAATWLFIVLNVTSLRRLRILQATLVLIALFLVVRSSIGFHFGDPTFVLRQGSEDFPEAQVLRMRALGILADPNDLSQFLLMVLPLVFLLWERGDWGRNALMVAMPATLILYGIFLTRSRGGIVGLVVVAALSTRGRAGWVTRALVGPVLAVVLLMANFTGGREVSMEGGADRLSIWSDGLQMLKSSPVWGVGYQNFTETSELTAHNSFLLCAAELGLPGYFAWLAMFVVSLRQLAALQRRPVETPWEQAVATQARAVGLTLLAFLVTAWFLSRAYPATPFLGLGMAAALAEMDMAVSERPLIGPFREWAGQTAMIGLGLLFLIYLMVRLRGLF